MAADTALLLAHYKDQNAHSEAILLDDNSVKRLIQDILGLDTASAWDGVTSAASHAALLRNLATKGLGASYSVGALVTPPATPTDLVILNGSATKTVYITRIAFSVTATAAGIADILLIKRSAANTGGTATTPTPVPLDSGAAAASAVLSQYSVLASPLGAAVGTVRAQKVAVAANTTAAVVFEFAARPIVLRGVAEGLALGMNGDTLLTGEVVAYSVDWYEL